jgi:hypothetical protein
MAFSFTKTGFGGFSGDPTDPKPKTKKVLTDTKTTSVMTDKGIDNIITNTYKTTTTTPGGGKLPYSGSIDFQKAFASARGKGLSTFDWSPTPGVPGSYKKYTTEVYKPRPSVVTASSHTETTRRAGLRFTGNTNITANTNIQPIKMNGGGGNPTITPKKKKRRPPSFKWVPKMIEDIGDAFSSLRLFRKGRRNKPFRPFKIRGGANPILRRR